MAIWDQTEPRAEVTRSAPEEVTDLVVDVRRIRDGFRDVLAQRGLEAASRRCTAALTAPSDGPEAGGDGRVAAGRCLPSRHALSSSNSRRAPLARPLRAKLGEHAVDDRQRPAPLEERFGRGVIRRLDHV